jgi:hypothetical protein
MLSSHLLTRKAAGLMLAATNPVQVYQDNSLPTSIGTIASYLG